MPCVVSRWQGEPFQKEFFDRKIALDTACGALPPSRVATMSPQVVVSVSFQLLPSASAFGGALFHDFGVAGAFTVGAGHGLAVSEATADDGVELVRRSSAAPMATPRT